PFTGDKKERAAADVQKGQNTPDKDKNLPARPDFTFASPGTGSEEERHENRARRERPAACQHGDALPADGLTASLVETRKQPDDADVINNPHRRELPMAPIDHGFADSQPHGE